MSFVQANSEGLFGDVVDPSQPHRTISSNKKSSAAWEPIRVAQAKRQSLVRVVLLAIVLVFALALIMGLVFWVFAASSGGDSRAEDRASHVQSYRIRLDEDFAKVPRARLYAYLTACALALVSLYVVWLLCCLYLAPLLLSLARLLLSLARLPVSPPLCAPLR